MERLETHAALEKSLIATCSSEDAVRHSIEPTSRYMRRELALSLINKTMACVRFGANRLID